MSVKPIHRNILPTSLLLFIIALTLQQDLTSDIQLNQTVIVPITIPKWLQESESQLNTFLTDKYNYFVTSKGNRVWGCAMNLAWGDLKRVLLQGQDVILNLTQSDIIPKKVTQNLNSNIFTTQQLSQQSYYVQSGHGPSTMRKINFEVSKKFPQRTFQPLDQNIPQQSFVSFAYLFKRFQYKSAFNEAFNFRFKNTTVPAFQAVTSKQRSQLYIKYYNSDDDFMIGIQTANQNDEILLMKTPVKELNTMRLEKVISLIQMYGEREAQKLEMTDKFIMPVLEFDYMRVYTEMIKKGLLNEGLDKYAIESMVERIKLKVDRFGVRLENQAVILLWRALIFDQRRFYLNDDFWLILREKGKKPYFVMLVREVKEEWAN